MGFHIWLLYVFYELLDQQEMEEASCDHLFQLLIVAGKQTLLFPVDANS